MSDPTESIKFEDLNEKAPELTDELNFKTVISNVPTWVRLTLGTLKDFVLSYAIKLTDDNIWTGNSRFTQDLIIDSPPLTPTSATNKGYVSTNITNAVQVETDARISGDANLQSQINATNGNLTAKADVSYVNAQDTALQNNINLEATARINADLLTNSRIIAQSSLSVIGQGGTLPTTETQILLNAGITGGAEEITVDTVNSYINFTNGSDAIIKLVGFALHTNATNTILTIKIYNANSNALIGTDTFTLIGSNNATVPFNFHFKINALDHSSIRLTKMASQANTTNFSTALTAEAQGTSSELPVWLQGPPANWNYDRVSNTHTNLNGATSNFTVNYIANQSQYIDSSNEANISNSGSTTVIVMNGFPINQPFYLDLLVRRYLRSENGGYCETKMIFRHNGKDTEDLYKVAIDFGDTENYHISEIPIQGWWKLIEGSAKLHFASMN